MLPMQHLILEVRDLLAEEALQRLDLEQKDLQVKFVLVVDLEANQVDGVEYQPIRAAVGQAVGQAVAVPAPFQHYCY